MASFSIFRLLVLGAAGLMAAGCAKPQPEPRTASTAEAPAPAAEPAAADAGASLAAADLPVVHIYKTPTCGCCADWVTHIEHAGFETEVQDLPNLTAVKQRLGVPENLGSCHTAMVGDYVIEGHVPADAIRRLLSERPEGVAGIAVPGMPMGSPGMEGPWKDPYDVVAFRQNGQQFVFESR
ncbi:MAG TPA: DUF411 domain-containing protein [Longimicrobiaceae bacterium]|nr:DUF411 domain-containing protein [Longimicrobiaceae bacterium]